MFYLKKRTIIKVVSEKNVFLHRALNHSNGLKCIQIGPVIKLSGNFLFRSEGKMSKLYCRVFHVSINSYISSEH